MDALLFTAGTPYPKRVIAGVVTSNITPPTSLLPTLTSSTRFPLLPLPSNRNKAGDRGECKWMTVICRC